MRKAIIAIVALVVVIGVGYAAYSLVTAKKSSNVIENFSSQGFEVGEPGNTQKADYIADPLKDDFGISIYPGAKIYEDGSAKSAVTTSNGNSAKIGIFTTADSEERVIAYYQKQIGSASQTNKAVLGDVTYTVIAKKGILDPIVEVYKSGSTTMFLIQKKK